MQATAAAQGGGGRGKPRRGEVWPGETPKKRRERIREERINGEHLKDIARRHRVSVGTVFNITIDIPV